MDVCLGESYERVPAGGHRIQQRASNPPEAGVKGSCKPPDLGVGLELRSSAGTVHALNC